MSVTEYALLALVIVVPLVIAGAVTAWSIDQRRYQPKRRPAPKRPAVDPGPRDRGDAPAPPA